MDINNLTLKARQALEEAAVAAHQEGGSITTQLLLILLREEKGLVEGVFRRQQVDVETLKSTLEAANQKHAINVGNEEHVVSLAIRAMKHTKNPYAGVADFLIALALEDDVAKILREYGLSSENIRVEVLRTIGQQ